jgi:hypothetical protein
LKKQGREKKDGGIGFWILLVAITHHSFFTSIYSNIHR